MQSFKLPSALSASNSANSISMERALKQIKSLLELVPAGDEALDDRLDASMSDIDLMLSAIER